MDGIKPFNYRPLTPGLLGQPAESSVQPLNANHISHTNFLYPEQSSFFDTHTDIKAQPNKNNSLDKSSAIYKDSIQKVLSTTQNYSPDQVDENGQGYFQQELSPLSQQITKQKKEKGNGPHQNQESMSVLSWLEQAQNRFPAEMPEDDDSVINSVTESEVRQSTQKNNRPQINKLQKVDSNQSKLRQDKNSTTISPMENIKDGLHKTINAKNRKMKNPGNKIASTLSTVNIELPYKVQDQVRNDWKSNDITKVTKQGSLIKQEKYKSMSNKKTINKNKSNTAEQENISSVFNRKQKHNLESKPVFTQTYQLQAAKVNRLQQALQVQRLNTIQSPQSEQRTGRIEERKILNKVPPKVEHKVVVINQQSVGFSGQHAFLERSYLGRLGPRSYK